MIKIRKKTEYTWSHNFADNSYGYLSKSLNIIIKKYVKNKKNLLDIGCGNGYLTKNISKNFKEILAIDSSNSAIKNAKKNYFGKINFSEKKVEEVKKTKLWNCITLIEVIEHLYSPDDMLKKIYKISNKNTKIIITTPYHGFIKNILILLFGKFDTHFSPLWEHGHIKFFSKNTLLKISLRNSFKIDKIFYSGRFFPISKSIILVISKK